MEIPDWIVFSSVAFFALVSVLLGLSLFPWIVSPNRRFSLKGRATVITGGAGELATSLVREIVRQCLTPQLNTKDEDNIEQTFIILLDISAERLKVTKEKIVTEFGKKTLDVAAIRILTFYCDISDSKQVENTSKLLREQISPLRVSVVINNAAIVNGKSLNDLKVEEFERTLQINALGQVRMIKEFLPDMIESGHINNTNGIIVTIASLMGMIGGAKLTDYCASKWAVLGLHESLRLELSSDAKSKNIHMLAVCPYVIDTEMFKGSFQVRSIIDKVVMMIFPALKVDDVATRILSAICWGEHYVVLPNIMRILPRVMHVFPVPIMDFILGLVGGKSGMDGFVGRSKSEEKLKTR